MTRRKPLPEGVTYRLVTFSFYEKDVERLDHLAALASSLAGRPVSRSEFLRRALKKAADDAAHLSSMFPEE